MNINQTALVLIDIQNENNFGILDMDQVISKANLLIGACRNQNIPIIFTRHINREDALGLSKGEPLNHAHQPVYYLSGTQNVEIANGIDLQQKDIIIDKYRWSAFFQTSLDLLLRSMNIKHLVLGGLVTDGCLMTSVFDAYFRDYDIHLVRDICSTTSEGAHMSSMLIMANWVYNIKIYDALNMAKKLSGEDYDVWEAKAPDSLPFSPENLREQFRLLQLPLKS